MNPMTAPASGYSLDDVICDLTSQALGDEASNATLERVLPVIDAHARAEEASLASYRELLEDSGDPAVALVMMLVMEDEYRHHSLLKRLSRRLRDTLEWTRSVDALPEVGAAHGHGSVSRRLVGRAKELVDEERQGAQKLRHLARQEADINGGLDALLLEVMAHDSEKHARLLSYVAKRLEARTQREDGPLD